MKSGSREENDGQLCALFCQKFNNDFRSTLPLSSFKYTVRYFSLWNSL